MSARGDTSPSIEQQLLEQPRRAAGIDARSEPVRFGELDSHCHLVGDIDQHGPGMTRARWVTQQQRLA